MAIMFLAVWGRLPPIIVDASIAVPEAVDPGNMIEIERTVRRTRSGCQGGEVNAQVIDSHKQIRSLEPDTLRPRAVPIGGTVTTKWLVPDAMPSGQTSYRSTVAYPCFPFYSLWPVSVPLPEVVFWVRENHTQRQKFGGHVTAGE